MASRDPEQIRELRCARARVTDFLIAYVARQRAQEFDREADLSLEVQVDVPVQIDEGYLILMLEELLDNAFKFSDPGTVVQVKCESVEDAFLNLTIVDHGRGMTAEQISQVGAYVQFERRRYEQQGQGLGLAIVRRIVELHGGKLAIESVPGQGTTVRVTLPIA